MRTGEAVAGTQAVSLVHTFDLEPGGLPEDGNLIAALRPVVTCGNASQRSRLGEGGIGEALWRRDPA